MSEQRDLLERLRAEGKDAFAKHYSLGMFKLCTEAADEIYNLRKALEGASGVILQLREQLNQARELPAAWEAKAKLTEHMIYDADMLNQCAAELRKALSDGASDE